LHEVIYEDCITNLVHRTEYISREVKTPV
jgi:hypothetical protein